MTCKCWYAIKHKETNNMCYLILKFDSFVIFYDNLTIYIFNISLPSFFFTHFYLCKFLRWTWQFFIIWNIRTIVFIFVVILKTFWPICPSALFRCFMSNPGTCTESQDERKQSRPVFELGLQIPFPMMITVALNAALFYCLYNQLHYWKELFTWQ